jgi:hypothetical protein
MFETFDDLLLAYDQIEQRVYDIPDHIPDGSNQYGEFLESLFGKEVDNKQTYDFELIKCDLKTKHVNTGSKTTLMTQTPMEGSHGISKMRHHYGDKDGRFYSTITFGSPNNRGLYLDEDDYNLVVMNENGGLHSWNKNNLMFKVSNKLHNVFYVEYETPADRQVKYVVGDLKLGLNADCFLDEIRKGNICVEYRLGSENKDKGTAFRIDSKNMDAIYDGSERITKEHKIKGFFK